MQKKFFNILFYELLGVALSATTLVLGGVPLMMLRREMPGGLFLALNLSLAVLFFLLNLVPIGAALLVCAFLVHVYVATEQLGLLRAGVYSVLGTYLVLTTACLGYLKFEKRNPIEWSRGIIEQLLTQLQGSNPSFTIDSMKIISQLPSALFILLAVTLWLSILFERRFQRHQHFTKDFLSFSLPESLIWIVLASGLFAFIKIQIPHIQTIAINVLNSILLLYFFQGLSILAYAFETLRVGLLIRSILYFILISQLFLLVSIFGISDFWLNYRKKLSKKTE